MAAQSRCRCLKGHSPQTDFPPHTQLRRSWRVVSFFFFFSLSPNKKGSLGNRAQPHCLTFPAGTEDSSCPSPSPFICSGWNKGRVRGTAMAAIASLPSTALLRCPQTRTPAQIQAQVPLVRACCPSWAVQEAHLGPGPLALLRGHPGQVGVNPICHEECVSGCINPVSLQFKAYPFLRILV